MHAGSIQAPKFIHEKKKLGTKLMNKGQVGALHVWLVEHQISKTQDRYI